MQSHSFGDPARVCEDLSSLWKGHSEFLSLIFVGKGRPVGAVDAGALARPPRLLFNSSRRAPSKRRHFASRHLIRWCPCLSIKLI